MMIHDTDLPELPLEFIQACVSKGQILWTYHVNMRLKGRSISRQTVLESLTSYEIIEPYPHDKYLPSDLVRAQHGDQILHILFAVDLKEMNVRVVTAYRPDPAEWNQDFRIRREKP